MTMTQARVWVPYCKLARMLITVNSLCARSGGMLEQGRGDEE